MRISISSSEQMIHSSASSLCPYKKKKTALKSQHGQQPKKKILSSWRILKTDWNGSSEEQSFEGEDN